MMNELAGSAEKKTDARKQPLFAHWDMIGQLTMREISKRYRSSALGAFWLVGQPLLLLAVYGFVFSVIMRTRWGMRFPDSSEIPFSLLLFSGLLLHLMFSDTLVRGPEIINGNPSYVKRIVFPLEILPVVNVLSALSTVIVGYAILIAVIALMTGGVPLSALLTPLPIVLLGIMTCGLGWLLSAVGVYFRDLGQFTSTLATAVLFTAPICFPREAAPEAMRPLMVINPLTIPVECVHGLLFAGRYDNWEGLAVYAAAAIAAALVGRFVFDRLRRGFPDVI